MTARKVFATLLVAGSFASVVAITASQSQVVSLQLWLACFATVFTYKAIQRLDDVAPLADTPRLAIMRRWRRTPADSPSLHQRHRSIEALVLRSRDNARVFDARLRADLTAMAQHFLSLNHGVDLHADPLAAADLLGESGWIIDPTIIRKPTIAELDSFMQSLLSTSTHHTSEIGTTP